MLRLGAQRLGHVFQRYGPANVQQAMEHLLRAGETQLRAALARWPDGAVEVEGQLDSDGVHLDRPVTFRVRIEVQKEGIRFDLSRSDPQVPGPVNLRRPLVEACCFHALIGAVDPDLSYNDGMKGAVEIVLRRGTVADAIPPAPVSSYMLACHKVVDIILEGLDALRPGQGIAHSGGSGGSLSIAWDVAAPSGERLVQYEIFGSSYGASAHADGATGVGVHLTNLQTTPIEILETEYPVRVEAFEPVPDSGGPGRRRGGLGIRRVYRLLEPARVVRRGDRVRVAPRGLAGGMPGAPAAFVLYPGTPQEQAMPPSGLFALEPGAHFASISAGGGGYGTPSERDPALVEADILDGYVTPEAARKHYGYAGLAPSGRREEA